jgi:hypothetical protein
MLKNWSPCYCKRFTNTHEPGHGSYSTSYKYAGREGTVSQVTALTAPLANAMLEGKEQWARSRLLQHLLQICRKERNSKPGHGSYNTSANIIQEGKEQWARSRLLQHLLQMLCWRGRNSEPGHGSYSTSCKCYAGGEGTVSQVRAPISPPANVMQEGCNIFRYYMVLKRECHEIIVSVISIKS